MVFAAPSQADTLYNQGLSLYAKGMDQAAVDVLEQCVMENPAHEKAYIKLGEIVAKNGYYDDALNLYGSALEINPDNITTITALLEIGQYYELQTFQPLFKECFLKYFKADTHQDIKLGKLWLNLLRIDPFYKDLIALYKSGSDKQFAQRLSKLNPSVLTDDFFIHGLRSEIVYELKFENFLTRLRRALLCERKKTEKLLGDDFVKLCKAISCYGFNTEYIFSIDKDEQAALTQLQSKIENADNSDLSASNIALYACYAPAYSLKNSDDILASDLPIKTLIDMQLKTHAAITKYKSTITALTPIDDEISKNVREQYEEFPYPRWNGFDDQVKNKDMEGHLNKDGTRILIAGCGTGKEAIELAAANPKAQILAIDLSTSSLAYAQMKAEQFAIKNVTFKQADILKLADHDTKYDFITSSGVLHHMSEPVEGWRVLTKSLKDDGRMRIAMYSAVARHAVIKTREFISEQGIGHDTQSIRNFRKDAAKFLGQHTLNDLTHFIDYFSLSECRDLIFHVQEHNYTCPRLKEEMDALGLKLDGFYLPKSVLGAYKRDNPSDGNAADLTRWDKFEHKNPKTFTGMYKFWCSKG